MEERRPVVDANGPFNAVYQLARALMAEDPPAAERVFASTGRSAVQAAVTRGHGVIRYDVPDRPSVYVVVENGTRYTTAHRPTWATDDQIVVVNAPDDETSILVPRLTEACAALREAVGADAYDALGVAEMVEAVVSSFEESSLGEAVQEQLRIQAVLGEVPQEPPDLTQSAQGVATWAIGCRMRLVEHYGRCLLSGNTALKPLAALNLFIHCRIPANHLFEVGTRGSFATLAAVVAPAEPGRFRPLPALDLEYYLAPIQAQPFHPLSAEYARTVQASAKTLHEHVADHLINEARRQTSILSFRQMLYEALLYYRCADHMYAVLLSVTSSLPRAVADLLIDPEAIKAARYMCEEKRVEILVSLTGALHSTLPDFSDPRQFGHWIGHLCEQDLSAAKEGVYEIYLRLGCPEFIKDLSLGMLNVRREGLVEQGIAQLLGVAQVLEPALDANYRLGEPNYLSGLYTELGNVFARLGRREEAEDYTAKGTPHYIRSRLPSVSPGAMPTPAPVS